MGGTNSSLLRMAAGDVGCAPKGKPHFLTNPSTTEFATMVFILKAGSIVDSELVTALGTATPAVAAASLGTTQSFIETINFMGWPIVASNSSLVY